MRKRIPESQKAKNAGICFQPDFTKRMTTEAYKRGFKNLSQFARHAMESLIATDHRRLFADFNRMMESMPSVPKRLVKKGLLVSPVAWFIADQLPNFYEILTSF
jgi:hypothetical protein